MYNIECGRLEEEERTFYIGDTRRHDMRSKDRGVQVKGHELEG